MTVARSVEMKHKPLITSAVAHETSKLFDKAGKSSESTKKTAVNVDGSLFTSCIIFFLLQAEKTNYQDSLEVIPNKQRFVSKKQK